MSTSLFEAAEKLKTEPASNETKISVRDKILHTAHDLFYSTGFKATGVDTLIKEAKVTKVTFYRHFPSKSLLILALVSVCTFVQHKLTDYSIFDKKFNFYVANDLGRNGYYDQKPIAELMGTMGEEIGPEFVLATGECPSLEGVRSVNDLCG